MSSVFMLLESNQYKIELLSTGAVDVSDNPLYVDDAVFTFTTATRPRIVSTSPVDGAVNVDTDILSSSGSGLSVTFDKVVDQTSVRKSNIYFCDSNVNSVVGDLSQD